MIRKKEGMKLRMTQTKDMVEVYIQQKENRIGYLRALPFLTQNSNYLKIEMFSILEEYRNMRYGRSMMNKILKYARRKRYDYIQVFPCPHSDIEEDSQPQTIEELYCIYEKLGFSFLKGNVDRKEYNNEMRIYLKKFKR